MGSSYVPEIDLSLKTLKYVSKKHTAFPDSNVYFPPHLIFLKSGHLLLSVWARNSVAFFFSWKTNINRLMMHLIISDVLYCQESAKLTPSLVALITQDNVKIKTLSFLLNYCFTIAASRDTPSHSLKKKHPKDDVLFKSNHPLPVGPSWVMRVCGTGSLPLMKWLYQKLTPI